MTRIILGLLGMGLGLLVIWKNRQMVHIFGSVSWAEEKLGPAGTYSLWKLIGLMLIFVFFMFMLGKFSFNGLFGIYP